ncbi:hypothetical protein diail_7339 [Diaporthe ilicicola]|nr:hypothetical protein diail_7339 [Diaporthe ilicicola]
MSSNQNDETYSDYKTDGGSVPVQDDSVPVEEGVDAATADSDAQLERDDNEAIDTSNIVQERTRGAKPEPGSYREPGDEEGLPS